VGNKAGLGTAYNNIAFPLAEKPAPHYTPRIDGR